MVLYSFKWIRSLGNEGDDELLGRTLFLPLIIVVVINLDAAPSRTLPLSVCASAADGKGHVIHAGQSLHHLLCAFCHQLCPFNCRSRVGHEHLLVLGNANVLSGQVHNLLVLDLP